MESDPAFMLKLNFLKGKNHDQLRFMLRLIHYPTNNILIFLLLLFLFINGYGQNAAPPKLKPARPNSEFYKKANKMFRKASIEAGHITIDYDDARKLFKGGNSGIAIETILASDMLQLPYWKTEIIKKNIDLDRLTGNINSVKKRRALFKEAKQYDVRWKYLKLFNGKVKIKRQPGIFITNIFKASNTKDTIKNLVLFRKGRICSIIPVVNRYGELYHTPFPNIEFRFSIGDEEFKWEIGKKPISHTVVFKLYYQRGETKLSPDQMIVLNDSIASLKGRLASIDVISHASVEGNYELNQELYSERAKIIIDAIEDLVGDSIEFTVSARENWRLFRKQISGTQFEFLKGIQREDVQKYVNTHLSEGAIQKMLEEQRYVEVRVVSTIYPEIDDSPENILRSYNEAIDNIKGQKNIDVSIIKSLERMQVHLYYEFFSGNLDYEFISELSIPHQQAFAALKFNKLMLDHKTGHLKYSEKWLLSQLIKMGNHRKTSGHLKSAIRFNTQLILFKAIEDSTLSYFLDMDKLPLRSYREYVFKLIPTSTSKDVSNEPPERLVLGYMSRFISEHKDARLSADEVRQLNRFYYTRMAGSYYIHFYPNTKRKAQRYVRGLYKYFPDEGMKNPEERLSIIKMYMMFNKWDKALALLPPLLNDPVYRKTAMYLGFSCKRFLQDYEELVREILSARYKMGHDDWAGMFEDPAVLGPRYFENAQIRGYYLAR